MQRPTRLIYNWAIFDISPTKDCLQRMQESKSTPSTSAATSPCSPRSPLEIGHISLETQLIQPATQCGPHGRHDLPTILTKDEIRTALLQVMMTWDPTHVTKRAKVPILIQVIHPILFHPLLFTVYTFFGSFLTADNLPGTAMYPLQLTSPDFQDLAFDLVEAPGGKWLWSFKRC